MTNKDKLIRILKEGKGEDYERFVHLFGNSSNCTLMYGCGERCEKFGCDCYRCKKEWLEEEAEK